MHWMISYFTHRRGPQDWVVNDAVIHALNVPWLYPGQIDLGRCFIQVLQWLGLAWNVKVPQELQPRAGIARATKRALSAVAEGQAALSGPVAGEPAHVR